MDSIAKLDALIDGAEELLSKLGAIRDPQVQELRDRVDHALGEAYEALARPNQEAGVRLRDVAGTVDDYIRDYPWLAVATGVLTAGTIAFIAGGVIGKRKRATARTWP